MGQQGCRSALGIGKCSLNFGNKSLLLFVMITVSHSVWISFFTCKGALATTGATTSRAFSEPGPWSQSAVIPARHSAFSNLRGHWVGPLQALRHIGWLVALTYATDSWQCRDKQELRDNVPHGVKWSYLVWLCSVDIKFPAEAELF